MESWPSLLMSCVAGLFVGGAIVGVLSMLVYQLRTGRPNVAQIVTLGPLKIDTTGLSPGDGQQSGVPDAGDLSPVFDMGGSISGSCHSLTGATLVLIGFVMPRFSCKLARLVSGFYSGMTAWAQVVSAMLLVFMGSASGSSGDFGELRAILFFVLLIAAAIIAAVPHAGLSIGRAGLRLFQTFKSSLAYWKSISRAITRTGVIGLIPLICYLSVATTSVDFSSLDFVGLGERVRSADIGLWVTPAGFVVSITAGLPVSVTASIAEQMARGADSPA